MAIETRGETEEKQERKVKGIFKHTSQLKHCSAEQLIS